MGRVEQTRVFRKLKIAVKSNWQLGEMRYLSIGYYMIGLSPLLSLFLLYVFGGEHIYFAVNPLVICFQVCSMILYFAGYLRREYVGMQLYRKHPFIQLIGILLILWGLLTIFVALAWHGLYVQEMEQLYFTEQPPLSFGVVMVYAAMVIKGSIWTASGLAFIVTSLIETKTLFPTYPD